ncbi:tyrosine-type recombinase/integrase, partial [Lacihabitans soyangensis]
MKHNIYVAGTPQRTDSKGFEGVRLVVSFGGKQMKIATGVHWKPIFINKDGIIQGDAPLKEYLQASKKINDLKLKISEHLETNTETTPARVKLILQNRPTTDFVSYAYAKLLDRHQKLEIGYNTYKAQKESIARLENFKGKIAFQDINLLMLESYKLWLKNQKYKRNTIWTSLKDFRTYLNTAIEDGIQVDYPFGKKFKMPKGQRRIKFLHEDEFQKVKAYYETTTNVYHREVLRAFLFSCYTGLRISDVQAITGKNIINKTLVFEPRKTKDSETKEFTDIEIPLHPFVIANLPGKLQKEIPIFQN